MIYVSFNADANGVIGKVLTALCLILGGLPSYCQTLSSDAQAKVTENFTDASLIGSVKAHRSGLDLNMPMFELGSPETISFHFDDLSEDGLSLSYALLHCTYNWIPSNLFSGDFMDGFEVNQLQAYQHSSGTIVPYLHYKLEIPNGEVKLKLSGNYVIRIFDTYNPKKIYIQQRFMVVEPIMSIQLKVRKPSAAEIRNSSQQLELAVNTSSLSISNHSAELFLSIFQNEQPDGAMHNPKPTFTRGSELVFALPNSLIFDGVNEYRELNIKSFKYLPIGIRSIDYHGGETHILTQPDQSKRKEAYSFNPDINGKFVAKLEGAADSGIEADYAWVYLTLPHSGEIAGKDVYLYGELTGWTLNAHNRMRYNSQSQAYELRLRLKQGYYNYRFVVRDSASGAKDHTFFEGNHYDTENFYTVLVYYRQLGKRYDRLVGYKRINTRNAL